MKGGKTTSTQSSIKESVDWIPSLSKTKKYTTESTHREAITPIKTLISRMSPMPPFPSGFPTPKSAEEAAFQCHLNDLSPDQGAAWRPNKVQNPSNIKTGFTVNKCSKVKLLRKD
jgi:hypothetical protein